MNDIAPPEDLQENAAPSVPHSREAEEAVIGAVLINPEVYYDLAQFLQGDDFYIHRLGWIWDAFTRLQESRIPFDLLTVSEELSNHNQLADIGGSAYLTSLVNQVPTSLHAEAYGRVIEAHSLRRKLLTAANKVATLAYEEETAIDDVMDNAEKAIFSVSERRMSNDVEPIKTVMSNLYDTVDELSKRDDEIFGVPTGFIDLDRLLGGLQASDLLIIAGRPGQGKSGFLMSVAKNAAVLHKKHVAVFSLEMSNEQVAQRMISQETGIDSQRLRTGKLADDDWPKFTQSIEMFSGTTMFLDDTPAVSPLQLRTKCRRLHMEYGLDLIVIDYLQLMGGDTRSSNRVQEVSYISRSLKVLAKEINVPVLTAAQLSRAIEQRSDKRPVLSDLRESGCLTGDTLITLAEDGTQAPLKTLEGKKDFDIWALNPKTLKIDKMPVSRAFSTGKKPTSLMKTRLGREIKATANHRFLTMDGWKRLDELSDEDFIAVPAMEAISMTTRQMQAEMGGSYSGTGLYKSNLSRERSEKVAKIVQSQDLMALAKSDIYWDKIASIKANGEEEVYDLTIPQHHNFVANNIIVHNSLEQDADIVMFIYRPDQYEEETTKQNVAEIIVAKHRNGPTGGIELIFRPNLAKFENAATRRVDFEE